MKILLQIFIYLFIVFKMLAQTNVGGIISSDMTWDSLGNPYIVIQNILVDTGVKLTINAGVIVKFNTGKVIQVKGTLAAIGVSDKKIHFTSNSITPTPGDWGYISFEDQSMDYDSAANTGSILKNCVIEYGGKANAATIRITSSSQLIDSCLFKNNLGKAIATSDVFYLKVTNCEFFNNKDGAVSQSIGSGYGLPRTAIFLNNIVQYNGITSSSGAVNFIGNSASSAIHGNVFYKNYGSFSFSGGLNNPVTKNLLISNTSYCSSNYGCTSAGNFQKNIFFNNNLTNLIAVGTGQPQTPLVLNQIIHNKGQILYEGGSGIVKYNTIAQNNYLNSYSGINVLGYPAPPTEFSFNNFLNNVTEQTSFYEIKVSPDMKIENNYWGTIEDSIIQGRIYDWFDDASLGIADYSPFLTSPDTTAPISPPMNVLKTDLGGGNIQVAWSPNIENDLAGYKIYWKPQNAWSFYNVIDIGNVPFYTLTGINFSDTIAITAYDNSRDGIDDQFDGNESWFSFDQLYYYTSISQAEKQEQTTILFPNPTSGVFTLTTPMPHSFNLIVSNILGEVLFQLKINDQQSTINLSNYPSGIYLCTFQTEDGIITKKLVLNK